MIKNWDDLLNDLEINADSMTDKDLEKLTQWLNDNVSSEKEFDVHSPTFQQDLVTYCKAYFSSVAVVEIGRVSRSNKNLKDLSPIQYASLQGYDRYLEHILKAMPVGSQASALDKQSPAKLTALHLSTLGGHLATTEVLLHYGADAEVRSRLDRTVLHSSVKCLPVVSEAVRANKEKIYMRLRAKYPKLLAVPDASGESVAHMAAESGFTVVLKDIASESPRLLLAKNNLQKTCLHIAILNHRKESVLFLTRFSELLEMEDEHHRKPIHYIAMHGEADLVAPCLTETNINDTDDYGNSPLLLAAQAGKLEVVKQLIANNADVNCVNVDGKSVLHLAAESSNIQLVMWLIKNTDIDVNLADKAGRNALMHTLENYQSKDPETEEVIAYLLKSQTNLNDEDLSGASLIDYFERLDKRGITLDDEETASALTSRGSRYVR